MSFVLLLSVGPVYTPLVITFIGLLPTAFFFFDTALSAFT